MGLDAFKFLFEFHESALWSEIHYKQGFWSGYGQIWSQDFVFRTEGDFFLNSKAKNRIENLDYK